MRSIYRVILGVTLLVALNASPAVASVHVWTGAVNTLWSNAGNWTGGVPATGELGGTTVQFGSGTSSTMDIPGLTVDQIHFTGTGNTITGSTPLGINGSTLITNILDGSGGNTLAVPTALTGGAAVLADVTAGQLTMSGTVSGSAPIVFTGSGASGVTLTGNNTYTGTTTVTSGTLQLNSNGVATAITGSSLVIGSPGGAPATVKLLQSLEMGDTTDVQVLAPGTLNVNSFDENVKDLDVTDGTVSLGSQSLTVNGPLTMSGGTITGTGTTPGTGLHLKGDVTATSSSTGPATISSPVALDGARTFTIARGPQATDLSISNQVSDGSAASTLTKAGAGIMSLSGSTGDTYTGATTVQGGVLTTSHAAGVGIPGNLIIGTGAGGPSSATLRMLQSSELPTTADVTVNRDGLFDLNGSIQLFHGLTVNDGDVTLGAGAALTTQGPLNMTGGTIGGGPGLLIPAAGVTATSSPQGPATISAPEQLNASQTYTVTPGTPPELVVTGPISDEGGGHGLTKAGGGTLESTANHTYTGTTTITGGTFIADGEQSGPFVVDPSGKLTGTGAVGPLTVAGVLEPDRGMQTGSLSFGAGGKLDFTLSSADPAAAPAVTTTGPVTIDPAAVLAVEASPGLKLPGGTTLPVIENNGGGAITGSFSGFPISTPDGVPLLPNYAGLDGHDFVLTAANVPPVVGPVSESASSVAPGQAVAMSVSPTDANHDTLTSSWNFGDGSSATGASTSHSYQTPGIYHVIVTVSDGIAQTEGSTNITVTTASGGGGRTATSSAYGATFGLAGPRRCVRAGSSFSVNLSVKRVKGKRFLIETVTKVVFSLRGQPSKTDRSAPYSRRFKMPASTKPGTTVKVGAKAYLRLRHGRRRTKSLAVKVLTCG